MSAAAVPPPPPRAARALLLAAGLAALVVLSLGGALRDWKALLRGRPWDDAPGGWLADAWRGYAVAGWYAPPLALAVVAIAWGLPLFRWNGRRLLAVFAAALVGCWLLGPPLSAAYQRHKLAVAVRRGEGEPSARTLVAVVERVDALGSPGLQAYRAHALEALAARAESSDARRLIDVVGCTDGVADVDVEGLERRAVARLAPLAAADPDRFLLAPLLADLRRRGRDEAEVVRPLAEVWRRRTEGGF